MIIRRTPPHPGTSLLAGAGLATILAWAGSSMLGCDDRGADTPAPGRIILLSMDTVRADHVSGYGERDTTPSLRAITEEGVLFEHAYASSNYTIPAHMSIFTGLDPAEHGVSKMYAQLDPTVPTLASILRDAGYRTQAFHEGVYVDARFGFDRGFEDYQKLTRSLVADQSLMKISHWMQKAQEERYFLFLHTYAAHFPYGGYEAYRKSRPDRRLPSREELLRRSAELPEDEADPQLRYLCTLYNQLATTRSGTLECGDNRPGEDFRDQPHFEADRAAILRGYTERIRLIDRAVTAVQAALLKLDQWDDTLLVVTSDHGDAFFEHGLYRHAFVPFDEVLRVPLIVSYPQLLRGAPERRVTGLVSHLDLMPTILGLAGIPLPESLARGPGMDLGPVLRGEQEIPDQRAVFPAVLRAAQMEQVPLRRVVVQAGSKRIEGHELYGDADGYLFDLAHDSAERENLREARPDEFARLAELGRTYEHSLSPIPPLDQRTGAPLEAEPGAASLEGLSADDRLRLRALGYGD